MRRELSPRQREVLRLVANGHGDKQIADKLGMAVSTVAFHVRVARLKLGVPNRAAAVFKAFSR